MEIQGFVDRMKIIYDKILSYFDDESNAEEDYQNLIQYINSTKISEKRAEFITLLSLISKISNHHHRSLNFNQIIYSILLFLSDQIKKSFTNREIFGIFKTNKRMLLFLIENGIFTVDQEFAEYCQNEAKRQYHFFFYPEIQGFIQNDDKSIESQYQSFEKEEFNEFRHQGENESYVCTLIRNDSIDDFVIYVNRANYPLSSLILPSAFETHPLLMKRKVTLVEYAVFFGSIQIFQYLRFNHVNLSKYLWDCVIGSNCPDLVHHLEENSIEPDGLSYKRCFVNSIKCHHNEFADYFYEKMVKFEFDKLYGKCITKSLNFAHYPSDVLSLISHPDGNFRVNEMHTLVESITITSPITKIENEFFCGLKFVKSITIPSSVTSIGVGAFKGCSSLTQIEIPSFVTSIGGGAFQNCSSLQQIEISRSLNSIEKSVFEGCSSLKKITIPNSVKSVEENAFSSCSSLKEIDLSSSLAFIGACCFNKCESLEQIKIHALNITSIESSVFEGCSSLTRIEIPSTVKNIGNYSFNECSNLNEIIIPNSVEFIGNGAFSSCSSLEQIELPSSIKTISSSAFIRCKKLKKIKIPPSVTSIESNIFNRCDSLEEILIPSSVKTIGHHAFDGCKSLRALRFYDGEKICGGFETAFVRLIGSHAFKNCSSLTNFIIPSSVINIGDNAFECCTSLEKITLPNSVISIGNCCFQKCLKLKEIELPSSLDAIGKNVFSCCSSLEKVTIPSSVKKIDQFAFSCCTKLVDISIPSSVQTIGLYAFEKCTSLQTIKVPSNIVFSHHSFDQCCSVTTIYTDSNMRLLRLKILNSGVPENVEFKLIEFMTTKK